MSNEDVTNVGEEIDNVTKKKIMVTGFGLCVHIAPLYEPHPLTNSPLEVECQLCKEAWVYSTKEGKFIKNIQY